MTTLSSIKRLHALAVREIFYTDAKLDYYRTADVLITLANAVHGYTGDDDDWMWNLGDGDYWIVDIIIGAYWHFSEWHEGQYSTTYAALCALGQVYSPGMENASEDNLAYVELELMAKAQ
jgi:hypothetical protein